MTKTIAHPTGTATDPVMEAGRLVSKIFGGSLTVSDRSRLEALDCVWCPTCYGYQMRGHGCWPVEGARLREEALIEAAHRDALIDDAHRDARLAESMGALGRALALPTDPSA